MAAAAADAPLMLPPLPHHDVFGRNIFGPDTYAEALADAILRRPDIRLALVDAVDIYGYNDYGHEYPYPVCSDRAVLHRVQNFLIANNLVSKVPLGQFWWAPVEERERDRHSRYITACNLLLDEPVVPDCWRTLRDIVPIGPVLPEEWFTDGYDLCGSTYRGQVNNVGLMSEIYDGPKVNILCMCIEDAQYNPAYNTPLELILRGYRFP